MLPRPGVELFCDLAPVFLASLRGSIAQDSERALLVTPDAFAPHIITGC